MISASVLAARLRSPGCPNRLFQEPHAYPAGLELLHCRISFCLSCLEQSLAVPDFVHAQPPLVIRRQPPAGTSE